MRRNGYLLILFALVVSCNSHRIKIACVGNSITEGSGLKNESENSYPAFLDRLLGKDYSVLNCGRGGTTAVKDGDFPYWSCNEFNNVEEYCPDIIIIKLGTNDSKPQNWNPEKFERDYQALTDTFRNLPSRPKIYLCLPVPVYRTAWGINDSTLIHGVIPAIERIGERNRYTIIDLYHPLLNQPGNFSDGVHPNEIAFERMAEIIASEIRKKS